MIKQKEDHGLFFTDFYEWLKYLGKINYTKPITIGILDSS